MEKSFQVVMRFVLLAVIIGLVLALILYNSSDENMAEYPRGSSPSFRYPTDMQQPLGPRGWGYRDPHATRQTLLWDQSRQAVLMPKECEQPVGYLSHLVESASVPKKRNQFVCPGARPTEPHVQQRQVATSPYANWASVLQP